MIGFDLTASCRFCAGVLEPLVVDDPDGSLSVCSVRCRVCRSTFTVVATMAAESVRFDFGSLERYVIRVLGVPQHVSDGMCVCGPNTAMSCASVPTIAHMCGVGVDTVQSWKRRGMDDTRADRAATALGTHAADIWPDAWAALEAADLNNDELETV